MDPLGLLARSDKWFLGGGKGAIYAPPFPRFSSAIGFWDECYLADIRIPRAFCVLLTRKDGSPVRLFSRRTGWRPDRLLYEHKGEGVSLRETRCVTEGNAWVSELELLSSEPLYAFQWSLLDLRPTGDGTPWQSLTDVSVTDQSLIARWETAWPTSLEPDRTAVETEHVRVDSLSMMAPLPLFLSFGVSADRLSWTVNLAQRHDESPLWETSLLPQKLRDGRLPGDVKLFVGTEPFEGLVHLIQQIELVPGQPIRFACGSGLNESSARDSLDDALQPGVVQRSEESWRTYFAGVPQFSSSDPYLANAYWYRWYGLRLNTIDIAGLPICGKEESFSPYITEGIGFFRNFVTYSAQAHLRELTWMHDPQRAVGIFDNLTKCQRDDGSFPGHNYSCRPARDFYHADFGTPLMQLHALHPGSPTKEHLSSLRRYAGYFLQHRTLSKDPVGPTLYDVFDQNETGQEYMSRYQFASDDADKWASFRVSGVDATVYMAQLFQALASFRNAESPYEQFEQGAMKGLSELSLDGDSGFFCDRSTNGVRSWARPLTGMYAFMLANRAADWPIEEMLTQWLPEFDLPAGFPATAASDPTFSADGEWKDRRLNCPWNGRSWPMANSHFVDAVVKAARVLEDGQAEDDRLLSPWRLRASRSFMKAIRLLFHDGDPSRPNSYEHYDPITGTPSLYRGYDDYMHSWIVDLILRHAVGVQPGQDTVDPIPLDVDWIECTDIPHPKGRMNVRIERGKKPVVEVVRL